jgi:hypothetical protein
LPFRICELTILLSEVVMRRALIAAMAVVVTTDAFRPAGVPR